MRTESLCEDSGQRSAPQQYQERQQQQQQQQQQQLVAAQQGAAAVPPMSPQRSSGQLLATFLVAHNVQVMRWFHEWDLARSGALDKKELRRAVRELGWPAGTSSKDDIDEIFAILDLVCLGPLPQRINSMPRAANIGTQHWCQQRMRQQLPPVPKLALRLWALSAHRMVTVTSICST